MLQRVFFFLILTLILPDLYIYLAYIRKRARHLFLRALYWLPTVFLIIGVVHLAYIDRAFMEDYATAVGWFSIIFFLFASPKFVFTLFSLAGRPLRKRLPSASRCLSFLGWAGAIANIAFILYGAFIGRTQLQVKEITYASGRLPEDFDGYRIVQLSDLHIGSWRENQAFIQEIVEKVNSLQPDLIVFTGDLVNNRAIELEGFEPILARLKARDGVYSIMGNHDYGPYYPWKSKQEEQDNIASVMQKENEMGWRMLNNAHTVIRHGQDSIALIGVENDGEPPFSQYADLAGAVRGTDGMFSILLSHNPTHWRREVLPTTDIDLMLAGHTHGMQVAIGHHSPASFIYPEWSGMYREGARGLYVNVGIGYVGLPFRFGVWPEITVITLRR